LMRNAQDIEFGLGVAFPGFPADLQCGPSRSSLIGFSECGQ
jgi:hypothetical protein